MTIILKIGSGRAKPVSFATYQFLISLQLPGFNYFSFISMVFLCEVFVTFDVSVQNYKLKIES